MVLNLPVLPATTAADIVTAGSGYVPQPIAADNTFVLETYWSLGLERRLRKYEHVRDVLNSWDRDAQNGFVILPTRGPGQEDDLEVRSAPRARPAEMTVYLYHSQRPGKWKKRWVTLRADGQVVLSKKEGQPVKQTTNICHLSDFDAYRINPKHATKVLKPPKKHCLAVKSQQRSSMFLTTENFVHFFCTDDPRLDARWYHALQQWRSWYLVNRLGEGRMSTRPAPPDGPLIDGGRHDPSAETGLQPTQPARHRADHGYQNGEGKEQRRRQQQQHQQGTSTSLHHHPVRRVVTEGDLDRPPPPVASVETRRSKTVNHRSINGRDHPAPPVSFPARMISDAPERVRDRHGDACIPPATHDPAVSPDGLLGRTYTVRQQAAQEREAAAKRQGLLTNGSNLLNDRADVAAGGSGGGGDRRSVDESARPSRSRSVRSNRDDSTRSRTASNAPRPKPLLDFSNPEYREPPQHVRKGRGYVPPQPLSGGLVDAATSPDVAIAVPPATAWRRQHPPPPPPPAAAPAEDESDHRRTAASSLTRSGLASSPSVRRVIVDTSDPKAPSSLPSIGHPDRSRTQRQAGTGRGIRTGDRNAQTPMLNLGEESKFVPGSLLAKVVQATSKDGRSLV